MTKSKRISQLPELRAIQAARISLSLLCACYSRGSTTDVYNELVQRLKNVMGQMDKNLDQFLPDYTGRYAAEREHFDA
jgi:hypothetical protein